MSAPTDRRIPVQAMLDEIASMDSALAAQRERLAVMTDIAKAMYTTAREAAIVNADDYVDFDAADAPVAFRNRNPGNVRPTAPGLTLWRGEIRGGRDGYALFESNLYGARAMLYLLRISYPGQGVNTIDEIVDRYAPGHDNAADSVAGYKGHLARALECTGDYPLDLSDKDTLFTLAAAMSVFEAGRKATALSGYSGRALMADAYALLPLPSA